MSTESDPPWRDADLLRGKYWSEEKPTTEIAREWGCCSTTVSKWLDRHGIENRLPGGTPKDAPWRDESVLRELYLEEGMSQQEIADMLECGLGAVRYNLEQFGIEKRARGGTPKDAPYKDRETLYQKYREEGYTAQELAELWDVSRATIYHWARRFDINQGRVLPSVSVGAHGYNIVYFRDESADGKVGRVKHSRLLAIAMGDLEPGELVGERQPTEGSRVVHHRNGVKWDDRPENLEVLPHIEHMRTHAYTRDRENGSFI